MTVNDLAQNDFASVKRLCNKPCLCTQIQFKNLLWNISWAHVTQISEYVEYLLTSEGFIDNQFDTSHTQLIMEEQVMSALMTHEELEALQELLQSAQIQATRLQLQSQFAGHRV